MEIIIDGSGAIAGRLASRVAKALLKGNEVRVINAEHIIITGNPEYVIEKYREKRSRGDPYHGPFYPKTPEGVFKRMIRGMLPKKPKGREALKRLRVFRGVPEEYKEKEVKRIETKKPEYKFITLGLLCKG